MSRDRTPPHQAHDHLFKLVCNTPEAALAVVRVALGDRGAIVDEIDAGSFQPLPTNEIDEFLGEDFRDLVFSCRIRGRETLIFFLVEHQRVVDPEMPLRALDYVRAFWAGRRLRHPERPLPLALAILVHQGNGPWTGPLSIAEMLDAPTDLVDRLGSFVPGLRLALLDLGELTPRAAAGLDAPPLVRVAFTIMRVAVIPRVAPSRVLEIIRAELATSLQELIARPGGTRVLRIVVRYALGKIKGLEASDLGDAMSEAAGREAGEVVLSTAQKLIDQGARQGVRQGVRQGAVKLLRVLLRKRFGALPADVKERLDVGSARQLEAWGKRVLDARTLADVFESTPRRTRRPGPGRRAKR